MIVLGYMFLFVGIIISLFGGIRFLVIAYQHNVWWFLGCLFVPIIVLIFFC